MPTAKQKKIIYKYCLLPSFVPPAFLMPILSAVISLTLIAIDQVFLRGSTNITLILAEIMLPVFAYLCIGIYCVFAVLLGVRTKKWDALVHDVAARNHLQPCTVENFDQKTNQYVTKDTLSYEETVCALAGHPYDVAKLAGMKLPNIKHIRRIILLVPIILQILLFIPQLVVSYDAMEERKLHAGAILEQLHTAFTPIAKDVYYDDPKEGYSDAGYDFYAHLADRESDDNTYLHIEVDENGLIYDITYYGNIDVHRTKEENISNVRQGFAQLHSVLLTSGADLFSPAHYEVYDMSDKFWTEFTEGSYYKEITVSNESYDDTNVIYCYYTDTEAEYDENSKSYVSLIISTNYSKR